MKKIFVLFAAIILTCAYLSCSDNDSFSDSPTNILTFSTDTVSMDTVFSKIPTSTCTFWVYNKSGDGIRCTNVRLANGNQTGFRVNVDGEYLSQTAGFQVSNVEIRNKDSIKVFVELTSPENGKNAPQLLEDDLVFSLESGVEQRVNLRAFTWDATLIRNLVICNDTTIDSPDKPIVVYGGIKVDSFKTLRITAGTTLYFHADAGIDVYGTLVTEGTADNNVVLRGDRLDNMFDYLPYDNVSGQWEGIKLNSSSYDNELNFTDIHSTFDGIVCDSSDVSRLKLQLYNSTIHNCQGYGLKSENCIVDIRNSQISNTLDDCVAIYGGGAMILQCTLAQFYPFDSNRGVALRYTNYKDDSVWPLYQMDCINSIVTGYGEDVIMGESKDSTTYYTYRFINSLLRTPEVEDSVNITDVIWETPDDEVNGEMNFRLVDIDQQRYDFHLDSISSAIGKASLEYSLPQDRDGRQRDEEPDIGCFEYQ